MTFIDEVAALRLKDFQKRKRDYVTFKKPKNKSFIESFGKNDLSIICEIKKASPTIGELSSVDPLTQAKNYVGAGAAALSVLTEPHFFNGSLMDLENISSNVDIPVLRKDFILDKNQLDEAQYYGADACLVIVALHEKTLPLMLDHAESIGLETLVEVHTEAEINLALDSNAKIIGVNNRNLKTLEIDLAICESLMPLIPRDIVKVAESGIHNKDDVKRMKACGADALLIGSSLMASDNPKKKMGELLS